MLASIEARLKRIAEEVRMAKAKDKVEGSKTVGISVPPSLYVRLKQLADARGGISLKAAAVIAVEHGLQKLGF